MKTATIDRRDHPRRKADRSENRLGTMTILHRPVAVIVLVLGVVFLWVVFALPVEAKTRLDLPSPLSGPGVPVVKRSQEKKIERAWRELAAGNLIESDKRVQRARDAAAGQLLRFQIKLIDGKSDVVDELVSFCESYPDYAAAWLTLSIAAEDSGLEITALAAARRSALIWSDPPWGARAADLERRWVDDRIAKAERLLENGDSSAAMAELQAAKAVDPQGNDSALLEAKILISNDQLDQAQDRLADIATLPDALLLQGQIGEERGDWQDAMESYSSLPEDYPGRDVALNRAQTLWRMTLLPNYARAAMATENLTRGDLAVVLVSVLPRLETMAGGAVPVMSDIVDQPGQREIITVVRLGIMTADRRDHLFYPESEADLETVRQAVHKSRSLLGLPTPEWCTDRDVIGSGCLFIPSPTGGESVIDAVLDQTSGATP
jgi:tetratricopeptide (TPR) repeat protein